MFIDCAVCFSLLNNVKGTEFSSYNEPKYFQYIVKADYLQIKFNNFELYLTFGPKHNCWAKANSLFTYFLQIYHLQFAVTGFCMKELKHSKFKGLITFT